MSKWTILVYNNIYLYYFDMLCPSVFQIHVKRYKQKEYHRQHQSDIVWLRQNELSSFTSTFVYITSTHHALQSCKHASNDTNWKNIIGNCINQISTNDTNQVSTLCVLQNRSTSKWTIIVYINVSLHYFDTLTLSILEAHVKRHRQEEYHRQPHQSDINWWHITCFNTFCNKKIDLHQGELSSFTSTFVYITLTRYILQSCKHALNNTNRKNIIGNRTNQISTGDT